jgi:HK97 family phage major capsid protein
VASNPVLLNAVTPTLLPPIITEPIFLKTYENSAVQQLARKVPMAVNATTAIPVPMDIPTAGWVSEGGVKAVGSAGVGVKTMTGKKVALLVPVSQEIGDDEPGWSVRPARAGPSPAIAVRSTMRRFTA